MSDKYSYSLTPQKNGKLLGEVLEFGFKATGKDAAEIINKLQKKVARTIKQRTKTGEPLPMPFSEIDHSGQTILRMNPELHRRAAIAAHRDRISLNTWLVAAIAEYVGMKRMEDAFREMRSTGTKVLTVKPIETRQTF